MKLSSSFLQLVGRFTRDINEGHEDALRYPKLDNFTIKVLWWNFWVFAIFVFAASYLELANYIESPFAWRVISFPEANIALLIGIIAVALPLYLKGTFKKHYYYRLLITVCLTVFSYLFVFITGGAIEAHFHFFIVIGFVAAYADWRLGWLILFLTLAHHTILDFVAPTWVFFYGENWLSPLAHGIPVLAAVLLTTVVSNTQREALLAQKELERRREEFISMASHELKTPVTTITILIDLLERVHKGASTPDLRFTITNVKGQLRRMTNLISDLLDASRIGLQGLTYSFAPFDFGSLVTEVVLTVREHDATREIKLSGNISKPVNGDRDRIGQVLMNLLTNAIKYSPTGTPVELDVVEEKDRVVVCVIDQGIGISEEHHSKIFESFYRVAGEDERTYPGMGIGLNIAAEIVRRHSGTIWVESEKKKGSKFYFTIPLDESIII